MAENRRLTTDEWTQVRRRWEGDARTGFDWLVPEIATGIGAAITRQAVADQAKRKGWAKGGEPSQPLVNLAQEGKKKLAQDRRSLAQEKRKPAPPKPAPRPPSAASTDDVTDIGEDGRPMATQAGNEPPEDGAAEDQAGARPPGSLPPGADKPWIVKPQPLGRPSKYRVEYAAELVRYFTREPFENIVIDADTGRTAQVPGKFPLLQEFAAKIGVSSQTIYNWAKDVDSQGNRVHPEFFDALARARDLQYTLLVQGALAGAYDSRFASLAAKNLIQWAEKVEVALEGGTPDKATLETNYVTRMAAAHERQMQVLQRRGLLPGIEGGGTTE